MTGFSDYQLAREALKRRCDVVEQVWREASIRSDLERVQGASEFDDSVVSQMLREANQRLASSVVEVGIFGSIKRGKSTLINALVGTEVSPMRVTPETAVPVWIQNGPTESSVLLADGTVIGDISLEEAQLMATQRYKARDLTKKPLRVEHKLRIPWLPEGVRIVDTPGLDDPSLADDYEKLTLSELDRVAATIFVMVSPPGPSGEEIRTLRTLSARAVDKLFLVCNFYPDHWNDKQIVSEMRQYIEGIVKDGAGQNVDARDIRVYPISARDGLRAVLNDDDQGTEDSGVAALRKDLESYLSRGALERMLGFVERRIEQTRNLTKDTLLERKRLLSSPHLASPARESLVKEIKESRSLMADLEAGLQRFAGPLRDEIVQTMTQPFADTAVAVAKASKLPELEVTLNRLRIGFETASSQASIIFAQRAGVQQASLQRRLYESFGVEERLRTGAGNLRLSELGDVAPTLPSIAADKDAVLAGAGIGGAVIGAGAVGLLPGAMWLALLGPVGWLVLGAGAIAGAGLGAIAGRAATKDSLRPEHRDQVLHDIKEQETRVRRNVEGAIRDWTISVAEELESLRSGFFREKEAEIRRIESILNDSNSRKSELERIERLLNQLANSER